MKAAVCENYGGADVLVCRDVPKPEPGTGDVLVRVCAASVTRADTMMRSGTPLFARLATGLRKPKYPIPGTGFAGIVDTVGEGVSQFKVGDRVVGESGLTFSANAEYVSVQEDGILQILPDEISFEEAAPLCDGMLTAYNFLCLIGECKPGMRVMINGASGAVGSAGVQIAKLTGAKVTGVCSGKNRDFVLAQGADRVIDYTRESLGAEGIKYDLIFDAVGTLTFSECKSLLTDNGTFLSPVLSFPLLLQMLATRCFSKKKAVFSATGLKPPSEMNVHLQKILGFYSEQKLWTEIDRNYSLDEISQAHAYVDTGRKRGNVILAVS